MEEPEIHIAKWKKQPVCRIPDFRTFRKRPNYGNSEKISSCQELGGAGGDEQVGLRAVKLLYETVTVKEHTSSYII